MPVDAITTEVIRGALIYAAEEMGLALRNAAYSPNIKERMDHSCTLFDAERRLAAQAEHIPVHLGSMIWAVQEGLRRFDEPLEEGDMLVFNDPYVSGTHLPDITLISPIFHDGQLVGYAANKAHHSDIGGRAPGSMAPDASELFQEGTIIPPVKLLEKDRLNSDVLRFILSNVRTPKVTRGDLHAQIAANRLGQRRLCELVDRYGVVTLGEAVDRIMDHSERVLRRGIATMPKGTFVAEDWLESTGTGDRPVGLKVTVTIGEDRLKIDYTGTAAQVEGPFNAVWGVTLAGVYFVVKCLIDPELPVNDGCFRPVEVYAPPATLLNPVPPAPVAGGNVETSQRNVDVLLKAFALAMPEKVCAACQGTMNNLSIGGYDPAKGVLWTFYETVGGGYGGRQGADGESGIHSHMTNTMNTPIEAIEATYPIRMLTYQFRRDSAGLGRWRGGAGMERSFRLLSPSATLSIMAERSTIPPWGLRGGGPGACSQYLLVRHDGQRIDLGSKTSVQIERGDTVVVRTPGGGGYGNPLKREAERVLEDVRSGLVSVGEARRSYGVIVDHATMKLDHIATTRLRKLMSERRRHMRKKAITV